MTKTAKAWIIVAVMACIAVAGGAMLVARFLRALSHSEWPAGARSDYPAVDLDPRLTQYAATAKPLIAALDKYYETNRRFPAQLRELSSILPSAATQAPGTLPNQFGGWYYSPSNDGLGYDICCKLGWDTALCFRVDAGRRQWVFAPGDGSADVPILLKP